MVHDHDPVAEPLGFLHVVRGVEQRLAAPLQRLEIVEDRVAALRIDEGGQVSSRSGPPRVGIAAEPRGPRCLDGLLARIIHERYAFVHDAPAAGRFPAAAGFDTALRAVLKTSPGLVLSEGPCNGPESKSEGRTIQGLHE
jgi:hypothetical protein